jgi:hypothetical protein
VPPSSRWSKWCASAAIAEQPLEKLDGSRRTGEQIADNRGQGFPWPLSFGQTTMLYKFKSNATGDLIMTQPVGDRVLGLIGKPVAPQGIIEVDHMVAAMSALEAAVAAEGPKPADDGEPASPQADAVGLRQRVWPMVEMMKRALAAKQPIVWGA